MSNSERNEDSASRSGEDGEDDEQMMGSDQDANTDEDSDAPSEIIV